MIRNFVDTVGEWNPQLFRELKGRFKPINLIAVSASSFLMQLVVFLFQLKDIPGEHYYVISGYCRLEKVYLSQKDALQKQKSIIDKQLNAYYSSSSNAHEIVSNLQTQNRGIQAQIDQLQTQIDTEICPADAIEWQSWWSDHWGYIFLCFSVIFVFILLVAGTYAIINDLAREEKRGTLNFIRLSPQSEKNILTGKMLGVPSLIYLFVLTAIPLHLWAGYAAKISLVNIFSYYLILSGSCYFFYSASMLLGLTSRWFSSFLPWLGSGIVLIFLSTTFQLSFPAYNSEISLIPINWFGLIFPWGMIGYLFREQWFLNDFYNHSSSLLPISELEFFSLPIGKFLPTLLGFHLLNYIISTHGIWQAIKRSFRHTGITILSKKHSYFLAGFFQIILIGLTNGVHELPGRIVSLVILNTILCLLLILALSPQRHIVQEWTRYRHQENSGKSLWRNLILGEKSPVGLAILINLVITWTPTTLLFFFFSREVEDHYWLSKSEYLLGVILFASLMMIYTSIAQLILLVKSRQRAVWSISTFVFVILLPTLIPLFYENNSLGSLVWLFSPFPWVGIHNATITEVFMSILADLAIAVLLNVQLTRQLKSLGESSSKALLAG
jgi:hypothetical protein